MRRILLIEDDPISQDIIRSLLQTTGASVDVQGDGISGLKAAQSGNYDAILIDYHLPEMDGYAIGRLMRDEAANAAAKSGEASPAAPGPVLIGFTADQNGLAARRGSDAVFHAILTKPIAPAALFAVLDRLCPARPVMPQAVSADPHSLSLALWNDVGLKALPRASVLPEATVEQRAALDLCFNLVESPAAEMILLLERHGINEAKRLRATREGNPLPIMALAEDLSPICDGVFKVHDPASWQMVARALGASPPMAGQTPAQSKPAVAETPAAVPVATLSAPLPETADPEPVSTSADLALILRRGIQEPVGDIHRSFEVLAQSASDPVLKAFIARVTASLSDVSHVVGTLLVHLEARQMQAPGTAESRQAVLPPMPPAIDVETYGAMVRSLGRSAVMSLTDRLLTDLEQLTSGAPETVDEGRLNAVADMAATAAMFGFRELASVCAGFRGAASGHASANADLLVARRAATRARQQRDADPLCA